MATQVLNQQPVELSYEYSSSIADTFDPLKLVTDNISKKLFTPKNPGTPVEMKMNGQEIDMNDMTELIRLCSLDNVDIDAENEMKDVLSQCLIHYDKALPVQDVFGVQAAVKHNLLLPAANVMYVPGDIIEAAKQFSVNQITPEEFFANFMFYAKMQTLGFYFLNLQEWRNFTQWFKTEISQIQSLLSIETLDACNTIVNINLDKLTESIIIRNTDTDNNEPYSFARVLVFYLNIYAQMQNKSTATRNKMGLMPFALGEIFCPKTIVFVNVEKHAHANPSQIRTEWELLRKVMYSRPKLMNQKQIMKLTAVARMSQKIISQSGSRTNALNLRSAQMKFRKSPPTPIDFYKYIERIYRKTAKVLDSDNTLKTRRTTYNKASRRHPEDPNIPGITTRTEYRPDLHVYLDCSGSINERMYQEAIKACIKLAKKMKINFYFTSFSHFMSTPSKLNVADKTTKQIYNEFRKIKKVNGGTDYEQIWHKINSSPKRSKQVSIVITDFEYDPPTHYVKHPRFLYYAPIATSYWNVLVQEATRFSKEMLYICPDIRKHMLM